jgi:hypothetical protein
VEVKIPLKAIRELSPQSTEELKQEMFKLWVIRMGNSEYLKGLVNSMPHRL